MKYFSFLWYLILVFLFSHCSIQSYKELNLFTSNALVTSRSKQCLECHTKKTPSIVESWQKSSHASAAVGCYECHKAGKNDIDGFEHFGHTVATIVSPKDCSQCHEMEAEQFLASHHAKGGQILDSLDNYLGEIVEGYPAAVSGCQQCHGSIVEVIETVEDDGTVKKTLSPDSWPNFGIGRINPDGTSGSCSSCHSRHDFSLEQARAPETCGKCHMGPDHPQKEVYEESKHGIAYRTHKDELNMDKARWVVGVDYTAAPTCATCHVSATQNQSRTHDIGLRISWNLRAPISKKTENSKRKKLAMKEVCMTCHNPNYVNNFYKQLDAGIELYNNKFAVPATEVMNRLRKAEKIDPVQFNEEIEWIYFYLWHHEGRRARNGIAMMGPDYTQWHGFYDIAERFYIEFVHAAEELMPGVMDEILARDEHKWFNSGLTNKQILELNEKNKAKYKKIYRGEM